MKTAADKSKSLIRAAKSKHNFGFKKLLFIEKAKKKLKRRMDKVRGFFQTLKKTTFCKSSNIRWQLCLWRDSSVLIRRKLKRKS